MTAKTTEPKNDTKATTAASDRAPLAARRFRDADTGRTFEKGAAIDNVPQGLLDNYRAAGLFASDDDAADKPDNG